MKSIILKRRLLLVTAVALFATGLINYCRYVPSDLINYWISAPLGHIFERIFMIGISLAVLILANLLAYKYLNRKIVLIAVVAWSWMFLPLHFFITSEALKDDHGIATAVMFIGAAIFNIAYLLIIFLATAAVIQTRRLKSR